MGKIRAKTLGDENLEQKEHDEAEKRREAKAMAKDETNQGVAEVEGPTDAQSTSENAGRASVGGNDRQDPEQQKAPKKQKVGKAHERSAKYKEAASLIEKGKTYPLIQALDLLEKTHLAKFDETVELHINTLESLSGSMNLPHGTGKSTKVAILSPLKDPKAADELLKNIEAGKITFDVLIATPDAMPKLAKVARILGPKGLMPNPKAGTVTPNPEAVAKQYEGGHMTFKTDPKAPVLHLSVGKMSFGKDKLTENIQTALKAVQTKNMKKVVLKSTMSPAIRLAVK